MSGRASDPGTGALGDHRRVLLACEDGAVLMDRAPPGVDARASEELVECEAERSRSCGVREHDLACALHDDADVEGLDESAGQ
jgi:hypothetical protein